MNKDKQQKYQFYGFENALGTSSKCSNNILETSLCKYIKHDQHQLNSPFQNILKLNCGHTIGGFVIPCLDLPKW